MKKTNIVEEKCAICGCGLHRGGEYAKPSVKGRSHATKHHFVAERFFGRSSNRRGTQREPIFKDCPWDVERKSAVFCYECHEELIHNPILLPKDIADFAEIVKMRNLNEDNKSNDRGKIAGRIMLFQDVIKEGLQALMRKQKG